MRRAKWIEGVFLIAISIFSITESVRLMLSRDPTILYDTLGPGSYLLFVSIGLLISSLMYISKHLIKEGPEVAERAETTGRMRLRVITSFIAYLVYVVLMDISGYSTATLVFFILMFRIVDIKSWTHNIILSASLTLAFYVIFVKYCNMAFPKGLLF